MRLSPTTMEPPFNILLVTHTFVKIPTWILLFSILLSLPVPLTQATASRDPPASLLSSLSSMPSPYPCSVSHLAFQMGALISCFL